MMILCSVRHSCEGKNLLGVIQSLKYEIPAFAGMTACIWGLNHE